MSQTAYLLVHKDHAIKLDGVNSGAETATLWLARTLAKLGKRVVVAAQFEGPDTNRWGVDFWNLGASFDTRSALVRARSLGTYHLIAACRGQALIESLREDACLSRHFIAHDPTSAAVGLKPSLLAPQIDSMICVSEAQKGLFVEAGADPEKVVVIPNGADLEVFSPGDVAARNFRKLVFVGALVSHKGIDILINAFGQLRRKYSDLTLDVFGSSAMWGQAPLFDTEEVARQFPGLTFHGSVTQAQVADAFRTAGACVIPSRWFDSFPLTAVEAQVTGCPVVAFDVGGIREAIVDGKTGVLISQVSEGALIETLDALLGSPEALPRMSREALSYSPKTFTWDRAARSIIGLCERSSQRGLASGRLGMLTTWNQECGLATYASYMLSGFDAGSVIVLGERSRDPYTRADEPFVERCWTRDSKDFSALRAALRKHDIKLLHLNCHYRFFPQPEFSAFVREIRAEGITVIALLHNVFTLDPQLIELVGSVDGVIVHSPENRLEVIANGGSPESVHVLPHGVVSKEYLTPDARNEKRRLYTREAGEKLLVAFGFIQPHKGIEALIEAVAHLNRRGIPARGIVAGTTMASDPNGREYLEALKALAKTGNVEDRIHFLDRFLTDVEVGEYLSIADLVLLNYQSQHYEASGACSLAVGAGALVATSIAPAFLPFGDAVFHMTRGYPAPLAAELLMRNEKLRSSVLARAREYRDEHDWERIRGKLYAIYRQYGFRVEEGVAMKAPEVKSTGVGRRPLRVLMQNRASTFSNKGGDTVVMEKLIPRLKARGVEVTVDTEGREDPSKFDLVHLFNFAIPDMVRTLGERARTAGVPFVVTTLLEDVPSFHTQSHFQAALLQEYVARGQDTTWFEQYRGQMASIPPSSRFENAWAVEHAAALFTNGARESQTIQRDYPGKGNIVEVKLGYEIGAPGDRDAFIKRFGVSDFVFCVGRFESRKNQLMLLKALENEDLPVVFAGGGFSYQPEYAKAVTAFRRKGRTVVLPRLSDEMLAGAYAAAKVHALPSWYELPGLVSLEAAYYGCNVVVTDRGTTRDYLSDRAFYCDPTNEDSILNAVLAAYHSEKKKGLKETVMANSWDATADKTVEAYRDITGWRPVEVFSEEVATAPQETVNASAPVGQGAPWMNPPQAAAQPVAPAPAETVYDMSLSATQFQEELEKGEMKARDRDFAGALRHFDEAEKMNSRSSRLHRARGAVLLADGRHEEARVSFERSHALDARDPKTLCGLGMCQIMADNHEGAYTFFVQALRIEPNQPVAIFQLIECSYKLGKFEDLEQALRAYVAQNPEDHEMRFCLGGCLYKLGRFDEAKRIGENVLTKAPDHQGAHQLIELCEKGESERASLASSVEVVRERAPIETQFQEFNSIDHKLIDIEDEKRRSKYDVVRREVEDLLRMSSLRPDQRETALCLKAEVMVLTGDIPGAESIYDAILEKNPNSPRGLCGRGALTASRGDWAGAQRYFEEALSLKAEYDVALAGLGLCAAHAKSYEQAWGLYSRALKTNFENIRALLGVIEVGYILKRLPEVEAHIREYLDIHPADLDFLYSLAGCYFAQGKLQEATDAIQQITLFDPAHKNACELRTMIENRQSAGFMG